MKQFFKFTFASALGTLIAGLLLIFIVGIIVVGSIASTASEMGKGKTVVVKENSVLRLGLDFPIVEREGEELDLKLPGGFGSTATDGLDKILANIKRAAKDPKIKGIYLDLSVIQAGWASIKEIRDELADFKKSGKWIVAYGQIFSQGAYYLATVADKIYMHPEGGMELSGLGGNITFLKNAFDKYGIEMQVIRGKNNQFKSAVEPYMYDKMSEANRLQTERYLNGLWKVALDAISKDRKIQPDSINYWAEHASLSSNADALKAGLIDGLKYQDEIQDELARRLGVKNFKEVNLLEYRKYSKGYNDKGSYGKDRIAIIYGEGAIVDGNGDDENIGGDKLAKAVRDARLDTKVKAVVLRVNSPGGSALASDVVWREMELCKKVKPVVVSFGNVAASGGYYISAAANKIYAQSNTITGSIGVFGVLPNAKKLANNLGITFDGVKTHKHADMGTPFRALDPEEYLMIQKSVDNIYDKFLSVVANGRKLSKSYVDSIGQGRVWAAQDALDLGLIDAIGGIDEAIAEAVKIAKLKDYQIVKLPELQDPLMKLLSDLSGEELETRIMKRSLAKVPEIAKQYEYLQEIGTMKGVQMRIPYLLEISR